MGIKKNLKKLMTEPNQMRISQIVNILNYFDFTLQKIEGSHFQFMNQNGRKIIIPVHNQKVIKIYLKILKEIIIEIIKTPL